jgi:fructosamine-3-kinase
MIKRKQSSSSARYFCFLLTALQLISFRAVYAFVNRPLTTFRTKLSMSSTETYMDALTQAASNALGRVVTLAPAQGGGASGGGGASTSVVLDTATGTRYFVKSAMGEFNMLKAEYLGVKEMSETQTIRVPTPIAFGEYAPGRRAFVIFEYLEFTGGGSQYELGRNLARMHRCTEKNGKFGFHVDNTIGATPQPNLPWMDDWPAFWDERRLGHMLRLTDNAGGMSQQTIQALRQKTRELLSHKPAPSLLHGDLWGGNKGFVRDNGQSAPCIFDPATYYGDREADVAMTYLFGGFTSDFYKGYEDEWKLPDGHEKRRTIYNLYHILNHDVLFGGGYIRQARGMIESILNDT